jgi:hypothetical protein
MADLWQDLGDRIKFFGSDWTKYSIIGSFLLYMLGYLTLRFHLTAIGVGTDLAVLDERYLFAGARCFVYLVSSVPNIVLIALPVVLVTWAGSRLVSKPTRTRIRASVMYPPRLAVFGIVFAVFMIQFVMRQCFLFSNLFLTRELPVEPAWLVNLLLDDRLMPLFFSSMVAGCAVTVAILIALRRVEGQEVSVLTRGLLALLAGVQILLLPVNYGVLISDKSLPRVAALGKEPLA